MIQRARHDADPDIVWPRLRGVDLAEAVLTCEDSRGPIRARRSTVAAGGHAVLRLLDGSDRIAPVRSRRPPSADDRRGGGRRLRLRAAGRELVDQQHRVHRRPRRGAEHRHCSTERRTRAYLAAIAAVTDRPVRTIVNTHHHGDHTNGNCLVDGATIIGHEGCRAEVLATPIGSADAAFEPIDWGQLSIAASDRDIREPARCFRRRAAGRAASLRRAGSHDGRRRGLVTGLLGALRR